MRDASSQSLSHVSALFAAMLLLSLGSSPGVAVADVACGFDDLDCLRTHGIPCSISDTLCMGVDIVCHGFAFTGVGASTNPDLRNQLELREFYYPPSQNPDFASDCSDLDTGNPFDQEYNFVEFVSNIVTVRNFNGHPEPSKEMVIFDCLNNGAGEPCRDDLGTFQGPSWPAESAFAEDSDSVGIAYCDAPQGQFCNEIQGSTRGTIDLYNDAQFAWCVAFDWGQITGSCDATVGLDFVSISIAWVHYNDGLGGGMTRGYATPPQ